jgi:hypothetical protein
MTLDDLLELDEDEEDEEDEDSEELDDLNVEAEDNGDDVIDAEYDDREDKDA